MKPKEIKVVPTTIAEALSSNRFYLHPLRIDNLFRMYMSGRNGGHLDFFGEAAGSYLLHVADFLNADPSRPECTIDNIAAMVLYKDHRVVFDILATEPASPELENQRLYMKLERNSEKLTQIIANEALLAFCTYISPLAPFNQEVRGFINGFCKSAA